MVETEKYVTVILAKKPELGKVKSRIANVTSEDFALKLALASIEDVTSNLRSNSYNLIVATDALEDLRWFEELHNLTGITILPSKDKNLSYKMRFVFNSLLNEHLYKTAILVPMDIPFLTSGELDFAFDKLRSNNYVLGPENNGGVYLIGMNRNSFRTELFNNVAWSTPKSFATLIDNFQKEKTYVLELKDDLNTFQDVLNNLAPIQLLCPKVYLLLKNSFPKKSK
ncbi:MAG: DUF2064 domain-containing protein [Patescibacteria group bacterium]